MDQALFGLCLVPRPHYSSRPLRFESRGLSDFVSDRLVFVTEMHWLRRHTEYWVRRPGKTPYMEWVNLTPIWVKILAFHPENHNWDHLYSWVRGPAILHLSYVCPTPPLPSPPLPSPPPELQILPHVRFSLLKMFFFYDCRQTRWRSPRQPWGKAKQVQLAQLN